MPVVFEEEIGYVLDPLDLAINKVLTLAGRDEPRDFLDVLHVHEKTLFFQALLWAAVGKDPGFTPFSLLELLKRRGKYRPEDFQRLYLAKEIHLPELKQKWLGMIESAESFISERPHSEQGALYYSTTKNQFITPTRDQKINEDYVLHFGCPGGVLPKIM